MKIVVSEIIDLIQESIFKYDIKTATDNIQKLIDEIILIIPQSSNDSITTFQNLMQYINLALEKKDYLFLADLLNYELKPLLENNLN